MRRILFATRLVEKGLTEGFIHRYRIAQGIPAGATLRGVSLDPDREVIELDFDVPGEDPHRVDEAYVEVVTV